MKNGVLRVFVGLGIVFLAARVSVALTNDNLLTNAGFGTNLSSWYYNADSVQWSSRDVNGSVASGSAHITNSDTSGTSPYIAQCVAISGAGPFDAGGRYFFPSGQAQGVAGTVFVDWYSAPGCSSENMLHEDDFPTPDVTPTDSWTVVAGYRLFPPAGAVAAFIGFTVEKSDPSGPSVEGYVDGAFFRLTSCTPADQDLCLNGGRFRVTAEWESTTNGGVGHGVQFNDDSGYFWFFSADNTEVVVKVLNACPNPFNHYWVFAAGLTNVLVTLNVEDTAAGVANHYINPEGAAFLPLQDTAAFNTCP